MKTIYALLCALIGFVLLLPLTWVSTGNTPTLSYWERVHYVMALTDYDQLRVTMLHESRIAREQAQWCQVHALPDCTERYTEKAVRLAQEAGRIGR